MSKEWFRKWFSNKYYLELYRHRDSKEATDLINLIQRSVPLSSGAEVLDVCCGAGRHSIEFAKRGFDVTGFDLSGYLIGEAKKNKAALKEKNVNVKFLIKDMRDFNFGNSFELALNIFSSFGYFETDDENFSVFKNVKSSLKKKGYFVFDFLNEALLRKNLVKKDFIVVQGKKVHQERRIENNFVYKNIRIGKDVFTERIMLYSCAEIRAELEKTGFNVKNVYGDYFGNKFFLNKSNRFILIAQKN
ncbi:MAG: class I SAM-dependent methyltransferase [Ignavibacteriae bacterium]|nr:class I SAM-dependent methyltransferase [Ignavibacteriota bacterium]